MELLRFIWQIHELNKETFVDKVFKKAVEEFHSSLLSTYSVMMKVWGFVLTPVMFPSIPLLFFIFIRPSHQHNSISSLQKIQFSTDTLYGSGLILCISMSPWSPSSSLSFIRLFYPLFSTGNTLRSRSGLVWFCIYKCFPNPRVIPAFHLSFKSLLYKENTEAEKRTVLIMWKSLSLCIPSLLFSLHPIFIPSMCLSIFNKH